MIKLLHYQSSPEAYLDLYLKSMGMDPTFIDKGIAGANYRQWTRDVIVEIDQPRALPINLVGFSLGRWTKFLTEYFDVKTFRNFLIFLKERKNNDSTEYAYICSNHARHSLGNCLFGFTVSTGTHPRISLVSRSCNLVPTGILDLSLGSLIARYVSDILGTEECSLIWQINHLQINSWPSLLFLINMGIDPEHFLIPEIPFQQNLLQVYRWSESNYLPSLKYQFYLRYMKKIQKAELRRRAGELVMPLVPSLPYFMMPRSGILQTVPQEILASVPNPYNPDGANYTMEELLESKRTIRSLFRTGDY